MNMNPALLWFLIGAALLLLELGIPGVVLMFFGVGAWITALTTVVGLTNGLTPQVLVFTITSVLLLVVLRKMITKWFVGNEDKAAPEDEYLNHQVKVIKAIPGGIKAGKVEHKGANWSAVATETCEIGSIVEIIEMDGLTFKVKPIE